MSDDKPIEHQTFTLGIKVSKDLYDQSIREHDELMERYKKWVKKPSTRARHQLANIIEAIGTRLYEWIVPSFKDRN